MLGWPATNVGKSILLCNNAVTSLQGLGRSGERGQNVLLITFELDAIKTGMRCLGALTNQQLSGFKDHAGNIRRQMQNISASYKDKQLCIYELPPDECSVSHIYAIIDNFKRSRGWKPDVVVVDYLDLMMSRQASYNDKDYDRQKHVATELRGLAKNEDVLVFTATQTNRSGTTPGRKDDGEIGFIGLDKVAESFGKSMPLDYIVSLNQTGAQLKMETPRLSMFVAKNRNGPKACCCGMHDQL